MIMPVPFNPQKTFEAYKFNHPDWNKAGHLICHKCGGSLILRIHEHSSIYAHICRTCGAKLYYTSDNEMINKEANEAFLRNAMTPPILTPKDPVKIKKSGFRTFFIFVSIVLLTNLGTILFANQVTSLMVLIASIHMVLLIVIFKCIVGFVRFCGNFLNSKKKD